MRLWSIFYILGGFWSFSYATQEAVVEKGDIPLAQVGSAPITERDFKAFVAGLPEWTKSEAKGSAQVRDYLQSLIDRALILREAQNRKLEQSTRVRESMQTALRVKVGQELEERYILPRIQISAGEIQREFTERNWGRQLKIAHILLRSQARAEETLAALNSGRAFESVAHEFSQNRTTAEHGGEKPYFYSRINATPAVRESLFSLRKGETSGIIPISKGYEIFKVLDERMASYAEMQPQILKELRRERLQAVRRTYIDSLSAKFQWHMIPSSMDLLTRILRNGSQEGEEKVFYLSNTDAETELYRYAGGHINLGEVVDRSQFIRQGRYVDDSLKVTHYLERDIKIPQLLLLQARDLGMDREPAIEKWIKQKSEEFLIREMRRLATSDREPLTEQEIRAYYEANPKSYQTSAMVEVVEIQLESEDQARELLAQIRADLPRAESLIALLGKMAQKLSADQPIENELKALQNIGGDLALYEWFGQRLANPLKAAKFVEDVAKSSSAHDLATAYIMRHLATSRSVRHGSRETEGSYQLHWHDAPRFGPLVKEAMEAQVGALIGPLEHNALYSIAKVVGRTKSGRRPFETVKKSIRYTLLRNGENESFELWLEKLRTTSRDEIVFFDENIEKLGQQLQGQAP